MLALAATAQARLALRALRDSNPELFATISDRLTGRRREPGGRLQGRPFRLDDGRTARLATYYDTVAGCELVLVWAVEESGGQGTLKVFALEPTD